MSFISFEYAVFLPLVCLLYWLVFRRNLRLQNLFVLVVSYLFYGWWDWRFLVLIAFTSLCSWVSGLMIQSSSDIPGSGLPSHDDSNAADDNKILNRNKWVGVANIIVNLLVLGTFKYFNFFSESFAALLDAVGMHSAPVILHVALPIGISFYTFQALSYTIDVCKGKIEPTRDIVAFFAYISFFPQLVAGPIERATHLLPQFQQPRTFSYQQGVDGCRQILWGLFKKMAVADNCAVLVAEIFCTYQQQSGSMLMLGAVLFAVQIYGDFSGYSDIAIGSAKLFGIRLMQNFKTPYFSRSIAEFWRRWHISLTTWFRDYLYIPMGGSRVSRIKVLRNTLVIFLMSGFWHGASWTFLAWGAYHALLFLPLILLGRNRKFTDTVAQGRLLPSLKELLQMCLTFSLVVVGWVFFRSATIGDALHYLSMMCHWESLSVFGAFFTEMDYWWVIMVLLIVQWLQRGKEHGLQFGDGHQANGFQWSIAAFASRHRGIALLGRWSAYLAILVAIVWCSGNINTFIYFQF